MRIVPMEPAVAAAGGNGDSSPGVIERTGEKSTAPPLKCTTCTAQHTCYIALVTESLEAFHGQEGQKTGEQIS